MWLKNGVENGVADGVVKIFKILYFIIHQKFLQIEIIDNSIDYD